MYSIELINGLKNLSICIGILWLEPDVVQISVETALEDGYRLINTAKLYFNEKAVGWAKNN